VSDYHLIVDGQYFMEAVLNFVVRKETVVFWSVLFFFKLSNDVITKY